MHSRFLDSEEATICKIFAPSVFAEKSSVTHANDADRVALVVVIRYFWGVHTSVKCLFIKSALGIGLEKLEEVLHLLRGDHPLSDDNLTFLELFLWFRETPCHLEPKLLSGGALFSDDPGQGDWALSVEIGDPFDYWGVAFDLKAVLALAVT